MRALPDEIRFAVGTLTRVRIPAPTVVDQRVAGRGLALGPLVGAAVGLVGAVPLVLMGPDLLTRLLSATLTVGVAAWLTRGLHWDGLADVADGLGSRKPPEAARAIMRRSDIGPFGVLTLVLVLAVQVLALALLPSEGPAPAGWIAATIAGRLAIAVGAGWWVTAARTDGLGAVVVGAVGPRLLATTGAIAAAGLIATVTIGGLDPVRTLLWVPVITLLTAASVAGIAARRFGGSTGDVLGATCELATAGALLALVL